MQQRSYNKAKIQIDKKVGKISANGKRNSNLEKFIDYKFCRFEQKITAVKADIFKFFIKSFLAQTSILICLIFALMDFLAKK